MRGGVLRLKHVNQRLKLFAVMLVHVHQNTMSFQDAITQPLFIGRLFR